MRSLQEFASASRRLELGAGGQRGVAGSQLQLFVQLVQRMALRRWRVAALELAQEGDADGYDGDGDDGGGGGGEQLALRVPFTAAPAFFMIIVYYVMQMQLRVTQFRAS